MNRTSSATAPRTLTNFRLLRPGGTSLPDLARKLNAVGRLDNGEMLNRLVDLNHLRTFGGPKPPMRHKVHSWDRERVMHRAEGGGRFVLTARPHAVHMAGAEVSIHALAAFLTAESVRSLEEDLEALQLPSWGAATPTVARLLDHQSNDNRLLSYDTTNASEASHLFLWYAVARRAPLGFGRPTLCLMTDAEIYGE